jgi:hypothetical protein
MKTITVTTILLLLTTLSNAQYYDSRFNEPSIIYEIDESISKYGIEGSKSFLEELTYSFTKNDTIYVLAYDHRQNYIVKQVNNWEKNRDIYLYRRDIFGKWEIVSDVIKTDYHYCLGNSRFNYNIMFGFTYKYNNEAYGYVNYLENDCVIMFITNTFVEHQNPHTIFLYNYVVLLKQNKNKHFDTYVYSPTTEKSRSPIVFGKYAMEVKSVDNQINVKLWDSEVKYRKLNFTILSNNVDYVGDVDLVKIK